jgi:hypothetical protein
MFGEDAWKRRHVPNVAEHRAREIADCLRAFGVTEEVAHGADAYGTQDARPEEVLSLLSRSPRSTTKKPQTSRYG